jgi:hypothetical protein
MALNILSDINHEKIVKIFFVLHFTATRTCSVHLNKTDFEIVYIRNIYQNVISY